MGIDELMKVLRRMQVQTGSLACLGCGYEHNCGVHGCAVLREAVDWLSVCAWIPVKDEVPPDDSDVFVLTRSKNGAHNVDKGYYLLHEQRFVHRGRAKVTHWLPIPAYPEEETNESEIEYIEKAAAVCAADYAIDEYPYDKDSENPQTCSDYNRGWTDACLYIKDVLEDEKGEEE